MICLFACVDFVLSLCLGSRVDLIVSGLIVFLVYCEFSGFWFCICLCFFLFGFERDALGISVFVSLMFWYFGWCGEFEFVRLCLTALVFRSVLFRAFRIWAFCGL